jgi:3-oxoadipate enol-lactonase
MAKVTVSHPGETPFDLFWTEAGAGPPLILVRGLGRSHRFFEPLMPGLVEHFRVIRFDNRGAGQSDCPPGLYTTRQMARDVLAVMDAAEVPSAWVLGMSMGGMVALDLALQAPQRVTGLVLGSVTPNGRGSKACPFWPQFLLTVSAFMPKQIARRIQAHVTLSDDFLDQADAIMDQWDDWAKLEPFRLHGLLAHSAAIWTHCSGDDLEQVTCPTLVFAGAQDRLVPCDNARRMHARLPDSELLLYDDTGHNMETERPERMAAAITDFVRRQTAAPASATAK